MQVHNANISAERDPSPKTDAFVEDERTDREERVESSPRTGHKAGRQEGRCDAEQRRHGRARVGSHTKRSSDGRREEAPA